MDNFGIFKLLNSFYDFMNKNKTKSDGNTIPAQSVENSQKNQSFSPIFNDNGDKNNEKIQKEPSAKPLQEGMLNTLKNHDDFVKRVMKNKNKT